MGAAAYVFCLKHDMLLEFAMIATFIVLGTLGILTGLSIPDVASTQVYMALTAGFALVLLYTDMTLNRRPAGLDARQRVIAGSLAPSALTINLVYIPMGLIAFLGGYLTACVGFGADLCLFTFGRLVWNRFLPHRALSDLCLSASSVVTMASLSLIASVARAATGSISSSVLRCWGAAAWIVCIGAPIGSLLHSYVRVQRAIRSCFYVLAVAQLVAFQLVQPPPLRFWLFLACPAAACPGLLLMAMYKRGAAKMDGEESALSAEVADAAKKTS